MSVLIKKEDSVTEGNKKKVRPQLAAMRVSLNSFFVKTKIKYDVKQYIKIGIDFNIKKLFPKIKVTKPISQERSGGLEKYPKERLVDHKTSIEPHLHKD